MRFSNQGDALAVDQRGLQLVFWRCRYFRANESHHGQVYASMNEAIRRGHLRELDCSASPAVK